MSFNRRLLNISRKIELHKELFPSMPDFEKWTDEQLEKYINAETEKSHKENAIKNYDEAISLLKSYDERGFISKEELKIFIAIEKEFWKKNS
mgnify:CR=1 FL=1